MILDSMAHKKRMPTLVILFVISLNKSNKHDFLKGAHKFVHIIHGIHKGHIAGSSFANLIMFLVL